MVEKVVAITGAAAGIGQGLARECANRGAAHLHVVDVDGDRLKVLADEIRQTSTTEVTVHALDLSDGAGIESMIDAWRTGDFPGLVINCAGIRDFLAVQDTTDESWERMLAVDLTAPFRILRGAARTWIDSGSSGVVINIASIAGNVGFSDRAGYCAAKAGVIGLTRAAALDLAKHGIRVVSVSPGYIATDISVASDDDYISETVPIGRRGRPEEIARTIFDIADCALMTGVDVTIDGGLTAGYRP